MSVTYDRQTLDHPNPVARFAHRTRARHALSLADRHTPEGGRVLDFGAGTGEFLNRLGRQRPDLQRIAVEPFMRLRYPAIEAAAALSEIGSSSIDTLCAFEVFEHLTEAQITDWIAEAGRILRPGGMAVVSVPIMEGLGLPVKEVSRALLFCRRSDHSASELMSGLIGRPVARAENRLTSHKGFSHRALRATLARHFTSVQAFCSPCPALPWWLNSQAFMVLSLPARP